MEARSEGVKVPPGPMQSGAGQRPPCVFCRCFGLWSQWVCAPRLLFPVPQLLPCLASLPHRGAPQPLGLEKEECEAGGRARPAPASPWPGPLG